MRNRLRPFAIFHFQSSIFGFPHLRQCLFLVAPGVLCLAGVLNGAPPSAARQTQDRKNAAETAARKQQLEENLLAMEERATGVKIRLAGEEGKTEGRLLAQPLFHYTDEPRRITDATLWGWTNAGRLAAICKIEKYDLDDPSQKWLYCFGSLSPELIDAEWSWGHSWSAQKPGIELRPIADGPVPAEGQAPRLRQMKEIANRFGATIINVTSTSSQEMRLLPRPIYRYEKPPGDLLDGTVFGLTTNGTNPDAILVIELRKSDTGPLQWRFGAAGMTQEQLSVKFDGKEVWSKAQVRSAGNFDTWTFFWENKKH